MEPVYLFDAQNRWGYEANLIKALEEEDNCIYSMLRIVGVMSGRH